MPEAIATTKRKFYKALDALDNQPVRRPAERSSKRVRRSLSNSSTNRRNASGTAAVDQDGEDPREPPNFSPWSHETFLARLKTFSSVSVWHPKPEAISEVEWAKRGWVCIGVNTVACRGGCEKRVVISLGFERQREATNSAEDGEGAEANEEEDEAGFEKELVKRYEALIDDGHTETCMWHRAGCKDDIYRLQVIRPSIWQPELRDRHRSLLAVSDSTRDTRLRALCESEAPQASSVRLLEDLPNDILGTMEPSPTVPESAKALDIALHGWRGSSDSGTDLLHCNACFQRIGLWMYQPDYKPSHSSSDDGSESSATIDLVEMHREHCPWRNVETQKASGSLSGLNACQILQRVVMTYARERRRRSDEQAKSSRQADNDENEADGQDAHAPVSPAPSRAEIAQQDKDRESRLHKLKSLFSVRKRSAPVARPIMASNTTK